MAYAHLSLDGKGPLRKPDGSANFCSDGRTGKSGACGMRARRPTTGIGRRDGHLKAKAPEGACDFGGGPVALFKGRQYHSPGGSAKEFHEVQGNYFPVWPSSRMEYLSRERLDDSFICRRHLVCSVRSLLVRSGRAILLEARQGWRMVSVGGGLGMCRASQAGEASDEARRRGCRILLPSGPSSCRSGPLR